MISPRDPDLEPPPFKEGDDRKSAAATSSLAWGVLAMFAWLVPPVGLMLAVAGLWLGHRGWDAPNRDRARLGVVLSVMALVLTCWLGTWITVVVISLPITDFK